MTPSPLNSFLHQTAGSPLFLLALTFLCFAAAKKIHARLPLFFLHPVLVAVAALILFLRLTDIDYHTYEQATQGIGFLLRLSVVALALPLYRQINVLRRNIPGITTGILGGGFSGLVVAILPFTLTQGDKVSALSAAPSSVTTPIAMALAEMLGGIPSLSAAIVVATGLLGAIIGPPLLRLAGVRDPLAFGLAMGTAAHGIGTARALQEGELHGAAASLGLCLNGMLTAALASVVAGWFY